MCLDRIRNGNARLILSLFLALASILGSPSPGRSAGNPIGPCDPGLVQDGWGRQGIMLAAATAQPSLPAGTASLQWLGHSSFLLTSPAGLRLLTDPHGWHASQVQPEVVTVSNLHGTHRAVESVPGTPRVLWGLSPDGTWNTITLTLQDVSLFNLPSYASRTDPEDSPIQNSIFVFRIAGLCVVHLGNLRHTLTLTQLQGIGKPDIVLLPADGHWTLSLDDALTVIRQLQPLLVIPMHLDLHEDAAVFARHMSGHYAVRRVEGLILPLARTMLPAATEVVLFNAP